MMDIESDSTFTSLVAPRNWVKFYPFWKRNNFKSVKEGREVGEFRDFVIIISPGQPKCEVNREVRDQDKQDYREEWSAYQAGREQRISGTPIDIMPGIERGRIDSLKALYIHTIEQLATLSDIGMQKVGIGAAELKERARVYLARGAPAIAALKDEIEKRDKVIEELKQRMTALESGKSNGSDKRAKKKPGWPKGKPRKPQESIAT